SLHSNRAGRRRNGKVAFGQRKAIVARTDVYRTVPLVDVERFVTLFELFDTVALLDREGFVTILDRGSAIILYCLRLVVPDIQLVVIFDFAHEVFLRVEKDLFTPLLVFERQFVGVGAGTTLRAARKQAGLDRRVGLGPGWLVLAIVDRSGHQRPVGIAIKEVHNHFHANARNEHG